MQDLLHAFPDQEKTEAIFVFARPYWFTFLPNTILFLAVFIFVTFSQYLAATHVVVSTQTSNLIVLVLGIFQLFALTVFLVAILDFYYDILIITDLRLVEIEQEQLFYHKFAQLNLAEVEDVNAVEQGFFSTLLDYGTIQVQTAGTEENFIIPNIRYPNEVVSIISSLSKQAKENVPEEKRFPECKVIAVIDGNKITDPAALAALGAMVPEDIRLVRPQ